jgi:hypothetical protein
MLNLLVLLLKHSERSLPQVTLCLVHLANSQVNFPRDLDALATLAVQPDFFSCLANASARYNVGNFLEALTVSLAKRNEFELLSTLLSYPEITLPTPAAKGLVEIMLHYVGNTEAGEDEVKRADSVFQRLQGRYSKCLDEVVVKFVNQEGNPNKNKAFNVVRRCLGTTCHAYIEDLGTTLLIALEHPEDQFCLTAVNHFAEKLDDSAYIDGDDVRMLSGSLINSLKRQNKAIGLAIVNSTKLVEFMFKNAPVEFNAELICLGQGDVSLELTNALVVGLNYLKDNEAEYRRSILQLTHVFVHQPAWVTQALPNFSYHLDNEIIRELLLSEIYCQSGLKLVTSSNVMVVMEELLSLTSSSVEKVRNAALHLIFESNDKLRHREAILSSMGLDGGEEPKIVSAYVNNRMKEVDVMTMIAEGLQHAIPKVVSKCLAELNKMILAAYSKDEPTDFQALFPRIFPCFSHSDLKVRKEGSNVVQSMLNHYTKVVSKKKNALTVYPPIGYSSEDVIFAEPKAAQQFLEEVALLDLASSPEAILCINFHKKKKQVLKALLSHLPHLSISLTKCWLKILSRLELPDVFLGLHMHFRKMHSSLSSSSSPEKVEIMIQFVHSITPPAASQILKADSLETFKQFLNGYTTPDLEKIQQATLTRITQDLWLSLSDDQQYEILYILLNIVSKSSVSDVVLEAKSVFQRIPISSDLLVRLFEEFLRNKNTLERTSSAPNKRISGPQRNQRMSKLTSLLELISYKTLNENQLLIAPLFQTLQFVLNHANYSQYDYILQLVLSDLLVVQKSGIDESVFRVDLLVTCIRSTDNPQTHNSVLLVLSSLAEICPDKVLLNVMPIFTFMGAHVLRQDDEYTFNVIESTVEKIIPSLVLNASHIKHVIQVFVDAIQHIPVHRRLRLFTTLVKTLGEGYLYAVIVLLLEKDHLKLIEFCLLIAAEFSAESQVKSMIQLIKLCCVDEANPMAIEPKKSTGKKAASKKPSEENEELLSVDSVIKVKGPVLMFIDENLMLRSFISILSKSKVESEIKQFIEVLLAFLKYNEDSKSLMRLSRNVLDKVQHLLGLASFVGVITDLWKSKSALVQKRALTMFNDRIGHLSASTAEKYRSSLLATLPTVRGFISPSTEDNEIVQLGLMSLQLLCDLYASSVTDSGLFMDCVPEVLKCVEGKNFAVTASSLVCLSHMVAQMTQRTVKYLNQWMHHALEFFEKQDQVLGKLGALACLEQSIQHLYAFLSPFLPKLFHCLFSSTMLKAGAPPSQIEILHSKISSVTVLLAKKMQSRHVIPALLKYVQRPCSAEETGHIIQFSSLLIPELKKEDIKQFHFELFSKYFLVMLDRQVGLSDLVNVFNGFVMRLNEQLFQPLYRHFLEWMREAPRGRSKPFFFTLVELLTQLKNIGVAYGEMAFEDALHVLRSIAVAKPSDTFANDVSTCVDVLSALKQCALYDANGVMKRHFNQLCPVIVHALVVPDLTPAISDLLTQLTITVNEDALWKELNTLLLDATRDEEYVSRKLDAEAILQSRQAAITLVGALYESVGEAYLVLLPETIPAIAECLEDEEMERPTAATIRKIEAVLGEPLQKYLQK